MAIADRRATTQWQGTLAAGDGTVSGGSGAITELPVDWAARTEEPGGKTSPEELAAAAHSSCFSMALALNLAEHGARPGKLDVAATVTLDEVDGKPTVVSSALEVKAQVDGLDADGFDRAVEDAMALCPIGRLFAGAEVTVDAELEAS
jgi:osmotically inducible protein OsmC